MHLVVEVLFHLTAVPKRKWLGAFFVHGKLAGSLFRVERSILSGIKRVLRKTALKMV